MTNILLIPQEAMLFVYFCEYTTEDMKLSAYSYVAPKKAFEP